MPFQQSDAITEEAVRNRVEEIVQENLQYRRAFRQVEVPDGVGSTWKIPQPDDTIGDPTTISPGADYPATEEDYTKVSIDRVKHGIRMDFLDEAVMDNTSFDVIADQVDRAGRQMREHLDGQAFSELDNNLNTSSAVGDDGGSLAFSELTTALRTLRDAGYSPDLWILDAHAEEDLLSDSNFNRATQQGDAVVEDGQIGTMLGADVVVENTGDAADHDAYLIDTDFYGYEAVWSGMETESDRDVTSDREIRKLRTFRAYKAIDSEAAIKVQG